MPNFISRPLALTLGGIGVFAFALYAYSAAASPTQPPNNPTTQPSNTPTTQPSNTPSATSTNTPTPTATLTVTPTLTRTPTYTQPPATNTQPPATNTPSVLTVSINGCDVTNRRIEVMGLPATAKVAMTVKLPNGATYTLQSVSNDGHGWIANVSTDAIKANCPATATPKPNSSGGGSSGGTGSSGGSSQPPIDPGTLPPMPTDDID